MNTLSPTRAWISICSIIVVSSATKQPPSHHDGLSHHGDSSSLKTHQTNGIQLPEHVLSTQNVSCVSADSNIFEIMNEAQESCKGNDMRCTFYHFINQGYQKIGTTDVNKQLFDDLLMKFDNWLLTAEKIDKDDENIASVDTESVNRNDGLSNNAHSTDNASSHTNHRVHIDKDHVINVTDTGKVHTHHLKKPHELHHNKDSSTHGDKRKNEDYIIKDAEYNKDHKYFEVFLPNDREKGKPRTIYVEIDKDKNEFVLVDEDIDERLHKDKAIKIELDELSEIADTAFNDIVKSSNHTEHNENNLSDEESAMVYDISSNSPVHEDDTNLDEEVEETTQNNIDPTILITKIPDDTTVNDVSGRQSLVVPNKYINQAPFNLKSQLDNPTDNMPNNLLELLESIDNEKDTSLDALDSNDNSNTNLNLDDVEYSYHESELTTEHEIVIIDNNPNIQLVENHDTGNDLSSSDIQHQAILQTAKPFENNKLTLTSNPTSRISDYTGSQLDLIPFQNLSEEKVLHSLSPVPSSPYTTVPILGKNLAKVLETDSQLQTSFPVYAILDSPSKSDIEHPIITSYNSPDDSAVGHSSTAPNIGQFESPILPYPPIEYLIRLKGSNYSPLNVGFSWLPSYSRIEDLRLPSTTHSLPIEDASLPEDSFLPVPISREEFPSSSESPQVKLGDVQETFLPTVPVHSDDDTLLVPEHTTGPSQLPNTSNRITTTSLLRENPSSVTPCNLNCALNSPGPIQPIPQPLACFPTKENLEYIKQLPLNTNFGELSTMLDKKETMIPYSPYTNSYPTFPYTVNPYLKPPYLGPLLPITPSRPVSKIPTSNSLPLSLDSTCSCTNRDYTQETKPVSVPQLPPYTPFSTLNPLLLGTGFFSNTLYPNLWNNIPYNTLPYSPYTVIPYQDIRKYPPAVINSLSPGNPVEDKVRPSTLRAVPSSFLEQPCSPYKISEMTPSRYIPYLPVNTPSVQIELSPSLALERDLQFLSVKYGIPLTKILKNLGAEISDAKACQTPLEIPRSKEMNRHSPTTDGLVFENRFGNEELVSESDLTNIIPLDSSLIGPHLNIESPSLIIDSNDSQINTVSSKTSVKLSSPHPRFEDQATILDSSLIGPHLSTLATSNSFLREENQTEKDIVQSKFDSSLKLLDSSLIGPHLELGSPSVILDLNKSQSKPFSIQPKVSLNKSTSQVESELQNQPSISLVDNSLIDKDMSTFSVVKPLLNSEIQSINEMLPELDFTELSSSDSSQLDFENDFERSETVQYKKPAESSLAIKLHKPDEFLLSNLVESELDTSSLIPLDSTLIGPHLDMGSSSITINDAEYNPVPVISQDTLLNTDINVKESENIILPPSLLPSLLEIQAKADLNLNIHTQGTKLNEKYDELSLNSNILDLPLTDISTKTPLTSIKETDFKILARISDASSIGNKVSHLSSKDKATEQHTIKSSEISDFDYVTELDSSLTGPSLVDIMQTQDISTSLDSSSKGQGLIELQGTSTVSDSTTELKSASVGKSLHKPLSVLGSKSRLDTSLIGPSLQNFIDSVEVSHVEDAKYQLDSSLIGPDLSSVALIGDEIKIMNEELQPESLIPLDSSLIGPSLNLESRKGESDISRSSVSNSEGFETRDFVPFDFEDYQCNPELRTLTSKTPLSLQNQLLISKFGPTIPYFQGQDLLPINPVVNRHPCTESNYILTPKSLTETLSYAQRHPHIRVLPFTPYVQMNPLISRWQVPQLLNLQNILQASSGLRPAYNVAPCYSNAIVPLTCNTESIVNPELYTLKTYTPVASILSPIELPSLANSLPLNKYVSSLSKNPSNLEFPVCNSGHNSIIHDDIMSLLDKNSVQLLKDMSVLPLSQSSLTIAPGFEKGVAPSLIETIPILNTEYSKTCPVLPAPITNAMVPSPIYNPQIGLNEQQNIPYTIQAPSNLQPNPNMPLETQFSEIIGPPPEVVSLPVECPNTCVESQWHEIPQLIDSVTDPIFENEFLQQPCLGLLTVPPSSSLNTKLQIPYQLPPMFFTPTSSIQTTPLPNTFTSPISPAYSRPLSVSYAKPITPSATGLPSNLPYLAKPLIPSPLPIYPYPTASLAPDFTSQLTPIKTTPSDYPYPPKVVQYRPIPSAVPCSPSAIYSSPYLSVPSDPFLVENNPFLSKTMNEYSPEYDRPISTLVGGTVPTSLTLGSPAYPNALTPASTNPPFDLLSPYVSTLTGPINTRPSNLSPAYLNSISPVCSSLPFNKRPISPNPTYNPNLQLTIPELQLLRPFNIPSFPNTEKPFLKSYQNPSINPKRMPLQTYSQTKQNIPCVETIESNLQTTPLTEEMPCFDNPEEMVCTYSNVIDGKYYGEPNFKCPLESLSCTLAPEEIVEDLPEEDLFEQEDLVPCAPCHATEPVLQSEPYQGPDLTLYSPLNGNQLRPYPAAQLWPLASINDLIQQNAFDNLPLALSSKPLKDSSAILPSILYTPLIKPLSPSIPTPNFPSSLPLLPSPCTDTSISPYNVLPVSKKPLLSSPYYSASQDISSFPIDPKPLRNYISPQVISDFFSSGANCLAVPCPISKPATQLPTVPYIPDDYILIPPTYSEPESKTSPCLGCSRPYLTPLYDQYVTPLEVPITTPSFKKMKPYISPTYIPPILPTECSPFSEVPTEYQPYIPLSTALTCLPKHIFKAPPVTTPYTELPSLNNIVQPCKNFNSPQWSPCTSQYFSPISLSTPFSISSPTVPLSNVAYSEPSPHIAKQPLTNQIIPSPLFFIPDTVQTPANKLCPSNNIPRYSLPSLALTESLETVPCYTPSRPLKTFPAQTILKPKSQPTNGQYSVPLSSLPYLTQPVHPADSYPIQAVPSVPCATQPQSKLSPIPPQYDVPCSATSYSSSPLLKLPYRQINEPIAPQFTLSYDPSIHSSSSARNPFLNPDFTPVTKAPSHPVPNDCFSSPLNSIILSNILQPLDICPKSLSSYTSPITSSVPLSSPGLIPLAKTLPQKSHQFQPQINSDPQLLPSNLLLESPLLKPLLGTCQNNAPLLPMQRSALKAIVPEKYPSSAPIYDKYITQPDSLVSLLPDTLESINPTSQYSLLRPLLNKHQSPLPTPTYTPLYSNYNILNSLPKLSMKSNIPTPIEHPAVPASDTSRLSPEYLEAKAIEETVPYEIKPDLIDRVSPLPISYSQQRPYLPILKLRHSLKPHSYITSPLQNRFFETTQYPTETDPLLNIPALLPNNEAKLIDNSNFIIVSPIHSEPLLPSYSPTVIAPPLTDVSSRIPFYTSLVNTDFPSPTYKQLPSTVQPTSRPQSSPVYLSPQEYEELTQGSPTSYTSPSPSSVLTSPIPPHITRPFLSPQKPSHPNLKPHSWPQSPIFTKSFPRLEKPIEVTPEKENLQIQTKYRPFNKITPLEVYNYLKEPELSEVPLKLDLVKQTSPLNPLFKMEPYTEYTEDLNSNDYVPDNENKPNIFESKPLTENLPEVKGIFVPYNNKIVPRPHRLSKLDHFYENNHIGARPQVFTVPTSNILPKGTQTDVPSQSTTALPDISNHYTNVPTKHFDPVPNLDSTSLKPNEVYPEMLGPPVENPAATFSRPRTFLNPYLQSNPQFKYSVSTMELPETPPISYPFNNIKDMKYSGYKSYQLPTFKSPQIAKNLGIPLQMYPSIMTRSSPPVVQPSNVYQVPDIPNFDTPTEFLEPQLSQHLTPKLRTTPYQTKSDLNTLEEDPEFLEPQIPYHHTTIQRTMPLQTKSNLNTLEEDPEFLEPQIPYYQTTIQRTMPLHTKSDLNTPQEDPEFLELQTPQYEISRTTPHQTKSDLNTFQEDPEFNEDNTIIEIPISLDNTNEDNELKTSLINYINKKESIKNNKNDEITIPLGNIAIIKKEPNKADIIETNNPSIGLKVWKSNIKLTQAELKLKFKDLSVNNFMPIVNNLNKYDIEEIRKIVKNYIDQKYGNHIEVNEPYIIDNKYTIIEDFDHNASDNKYNLLWPTNYV